ncbi:MAG: hypothetical protein L0I76_33405 [Pseudonocardia sp.]|nr:hypothetical protein [Pseudonocardia sp.]
MMLQLADALAYLIEKRVPENVTPYGAALGRAGLAVQVRDHADVIADEAVRDAIGRGAPPQFIASALGVTEQAVRKRWAAPLRGDKQVAVVISRRSKVRDELGRTYGEVGGTQQYDSDRAWWYIGDEVMQEARYAIIAVDGVVERVYRLDPGGWERDPDSGKRAFSGRLCAPGEAQAALAAGDLPMGLGDACPTRRGGAYRPCWF